MKKLVIPIVLTLIGGAAGVGAKMYLSPSAEQGPEEMSHKSEAEHSDAAHTETHELGGHSDDHSAIEVDYIKIPQQFVVPVMHHGEMKSMVIMSLAIEAPADLRETINHLQPKLRDNFLRILFQHANIGGFDGNFTEVEPMEILQRALTDHAKATIDPRVANVLVLEIARQDS